MPLTVLCSLIAVRVMRSMRSLARISSWAQRKTYKTEAHGSGQDEVVEASAGGDGKGQEAGQKKDKEKSKKEKADTLGIRVISSSSFEASAFSLSFETRLAISSPFATSKSERIQKQRLSKPKRSLLGQLTIKPPLESEPRLQERNKHIRLWSRFYMFPWHNLIISFYFRYRFLFVEVFCFLDEDRIKAVAVLQVNQSRITSIDFHSVLQ
jgi:hypothetical protein